MAGTFTQHNQQTFTGYEAGAGAGQSAGDGAELGGTTLEALCFCSRGVLRFSERLMVLTCDWTFTHSPVHSLTSV